MLSQNVLLLAIEDTQDRYRRSALGPIWMSFTLGISAGALGFLYAKILHQPMDKYLPFITATLFVWLFFVAVLNESTTAFVGGAAMIKNSAQPIAMHVSRVILRNFIVMLHTLPVLIIVLAIFKSLGHVDIINSLFGIVLLFANINWICLILAVMGARFRDMTYIVGYILQFLMFASPIFWSPAMIEKAGWYVNFNPVFHWIVVSRDPILGNPMPWASVNFCLVTAAVGSVMAILIFAYSRPRIAFWV